MTKPDETRLGSLSEAQIREGRLRHASAPPSIRRGPNTRRMVPRDADLAAAGSGGGFCGFELLENDPPFSAARTRSVRFVRFLTSALSNHVE